MGPVDLKPELIISVQIDPLGPREGDPVNPITVIMENQGQALAGPTKAFFGHFPFLAADRFFLLISSVHSVRTLNIMGGIKALELLDYCWNGRPLR